jgi:hypothetical protein
MSGERAPRAALELLDREEERALAELARALARAAEELPLGAVRAAARRHPELTVAASAALGVLLAPALTRVAGAVLPVLLARRRPGLARSLSGWTRRSAP